MNSGDTNGDADRDGLPIEATETAKDLPTGEPGSLKPGDANEEEFGGRPAYLFFSGELAGVTLDPSGANLPEQPGGEPWRLDRSFVLGVRDVGLLDMNPEPLVQGIKTDGYYVWRPGAPGLKRSEAGPWSR